MRWLRLAKDDFTWVARRPDIEVLDVKTAADTMLAPPLLSPAATETIFSRSYPSSPVFVATVSEATVITEDAYVVTRMQEMIRESAARHADGVTAYEAWMSGEFPEAAPATPDDAPLLVATQRHRNYFHWWIDVLPRLWVAETVLGAAARPLVVPPLRYEFQRESLEALGVADRVAELGAHPTRYRSLHIAQGLAFGAAQHVSPLVADYATWLRRRIPSTAPGGGCKRLILTRERARQRRIVNGEGVRRALEPIGFEDVQLEELPPAEQRARFAGAEVVVAVHGAGLTNLLFARPGTLVVELFPHGTVHDSCYRRLAHHLGMPYACIQGSSRSTQLPDTANSDLEIDGPMLRDDVERLVSGADRER